MKMFSLMKVRFIILLMLLCISTRGQDTLQQMQELYNGTIWIDYLSVLKGDQFLFSWPFRPGSVTIRGRTFTVGLRYDLYEDQVQISAGRFGVLQLNKELIDSFSLTEEGRDLKFVPLRVEGSGPSFYQVLYQGEVLLYGRYSKKIDRLAREGEPRGFYQVNRIYLVQNGGFVSVSSRDDLLRAMEDKKKEIRLFMRRGARINLRDPGSFVPAVRHYDSLIRKS